MPFCFLSFSYFEKRDTTGVGAQALAPLKMAVIASQDPPNSRLAPKSSICLSCLQDSISPRVSNILLLWQTGSLGSKLLLSWGVMRKTFFLRVLRLLCPCWAQCLAGQLQSVSRCQPEMQDFVSLKTGFSSLSWTLEAACPTGRSLPPCTAGSSATRTAEATVRALLQARPETHIYTFCSFHAPSVSFFPWHLVPHSCSQQSAADILDRRSLYIAFVRAVFSHADE